MVIDFTNFCTLIALVVSEEKVCAGLSPPMDESDDFVRAFMSPRRDELPTGYRKSRFDFDRKVG